MERIITTIDSLEEDTSRFDDVPVYNATIKDEVFPNAHPKCFLGAWYHKVVSSTDCWLGIEALLQLGEFEFDQDRFNLDGKMRYMDNHNVYMGGSAGFESDCGLGYNTMYPTRDTTSEITASSPKLGYRPFYRFICSERVEKGGNVDVVSTNYWRASDPKSFCYYYYPGDIVRMKVYSPIPNYLQLRIEFVEATKIPKYVELRKSYHLKNDRPSDYYSPLFYSEHQGCGKAEFKRVNSIDQYGNEGSVAYQTKAYVKDEIWKECFLYREIDGVLYKVPFTSNRQIALSCPDTLATNVCEFVSELGGEIVNLYPSKSKMGR